MVRAAIEETLYVFEVRVDNMRCETALERIRGYISHRSGQGTRKIFFTNVHSIHLARRDPALRHRINHADLVLPDGSGLDLAGRLFGAPIIENLNGTDFSVKILQEAERSGWTVYLLGARESVIERCRESFQLQYPRLKVIGTHHGYFSKEEEQLILRDINTLKPDILFVALGTPLQEEWLSDRAHELDAGVCLGVGGLFDFISRRRSRAPLWMRRSGIEWIHRFVQDPKSKWERVFIEIPSFLMRLLVSRLAIKRTKPAVVRTRVLI